MSEVKTVEISVQRALTELKGIKRKVDNLGRPSDMGTLLYPGKLIVGLYSKEKYVERGKDAIKKVEDLLSRRSTLKAAIYASNATVKVTIAGEEMTVAQAIARKENLPAQKQYLVGITSLNNRAKAEYAQAEEKLNQAIEKLITETLGKDAKKTDEAAKGIIDQYKKTNLPELILVLPDTDLETKLTKLQAFEDDVDTVLSESNALTKIAV